jgi:methionyl-tRNA formyltransferase
MSYRIAIAGSTTHTVRMAAALQADPRFEIAYTVSPAPKPVGRQQVLTANPLAEWARDSQLENLEVARRLDDTLRAAITAAGEIDLLLVVDFGYLIPQWLLDWPKIAPLNIHPSALPKWRGSSPGQFALLFEGLTDHDQHSAITLMVMSAGLDEGAIINQLPFTIEPTWTQTEYYQHAFALLAPQLPDLLVTFAENPSHLTPQPAISPTMIARRLNKADSYVPWAALKQLQQGQFYETAENSDTNGLLLELLANSKLCPNAAVQIRLISNACRAFQPWPKLWTLLPTHKGEQRMQIFSVAANAQQLQLEQVQIEGKSPCRFAECRNVVKE